MPDDTNNFRSDDQREPTVPADVSARIDAALGQPPGPHVQGEFDETVATITTAGVEPVVLPAALRTTLESGAAAYFAGRHATDRDTALPPRRGAPWWLVLVAPLAAAAGVAILLGGRLPDARTVSPSALRAEDQLREWLLANPALKPTRFAPVGSTEDPSEQPSGGDVVWSDADQRGFMRFADLPINDPRQWQYQLWIFDKDRDDRYPVDGGVFDAPASGDGVVAIHAKIRVNQATVFAVTRERPGGVVVSDRKQLVLLAKMSG